MGAEPPPLDVGSGREPDGVSANQTLRWLQHRWLEPGAWPIPGWYSKPQPRKVEGYEDYFARQLRARYTELEADFRSVFGNFAAGTFPREWLDEVTAERTVGMLHQAREALESETPDLVNVANLLDLVERYMIWLLPPHMVLAQIPLVRLRIAQLPSNERKLFTEQLDDASTSAETDPPSRVLAKLRPVFDAVTSLYNKHLLQSAIGSGLQIERLRALRLWGCLLLMIFLIASPIAMPSSGGPPEAGTFQVPVPVPVPAPAPLPPPFAAWIVALGIGILGAVGGFLSGLLQVRDSLVTLAEYQASMLKLQLRPVVGAIVALVLCIFLAWDIVPGVRVVNPGTYFFVAFASGFSERFFLKLLNVQPEDSAQKAATQRNATSESGTRLDQSRPLGAVAEGNGQQGSPVTK
jgi:hypothetical protein